MAKTEPLEFRHVRLSVCPSVTADLLGNYKYYSDEIWWEYVLYEPLQKYDTK